MKTCVITLDLINEICHKNGKLARYADRIEKNNILKKINHLLAWAREKNYLIIHVKLAFRSNYYDASTISPLFSAAKNNEVLKINNWGTQFISALDRRDNDIEIIKHRVSAFYGTDLDLILRANRIEQLILCGVATNNAVELTAREAHDRDYHVTIVSDASESADDESQKASLNFLARISNISTTNALIG